MLQITRTKPEGFELVTDIISLKQIINPRLRGKNLYADSNLEPKKQFIYVWSPKTETFNPKYYWKAIPDSKVTDLIKKGLLYASR